MAHFKKKAKSLPSDHRKRLADGMKTCRSKLGRKTFNAAYKKL